MNVYGNGIPEIGIILVVLAPLICFVRMYQKTGNNRPSRKSRVPQSLVTPDMRRDDV